MDREDVQEVEEENDESKVEQNEGMNSGEKEVDKPRDMKKNEKAKEREEDSKVLKKRPEPEGKGREKGKVTIDEIENINKEETSKKKGHGTALKDIPNVARNLSRRMWYDDPCRLFHTILFGSQGDARLRQSYISEFSGIACRSNEEKDEIKEKLDECNKKQLVELCELLDIQVSKAYFAKKEELIVMLMEFLEAPHVTTTSELLSEKEHSSKGKKHSSGNKFAGSSSNQSSKSQKRAKTASGEGEGAFKPSDEQLKVAICDLLKQADFNTANFTWILQQLAKQFESDLTARKLSIKLMLRDQLTRIVYEEDLQ